MKYHNITTDDMKNGDGLRVVLWLSGCDHHCKGCQNPITWNFNDGLEFDINAERELYLELGKRYISGITFSGGDPFYDKNRFGMYELIERIKFRFPQKTTWIYTGYTWEELTRNKYAKYIPGILHYTDVLVDGRYQEENRDVNYPWAGSTNQRVIDVQKTLEKGSVVLHENH